MSEECIIVYVEGNNIVKKEVVKKDLTQTVKEYAKRLIESWNPEESDFVILKTTKVVSLNLPLSKELYAKVEKYGVRRVGNKAEFELPTYEIIYNSKWVGENMEADKYAIIMPYVNDEVVNQVVNDIIASLKAAGEAGEEALEE